MSRRHNKSFEARRGDAATPRGLNDGVNPPTHGHWRQHCRVVAFRTLARCKAGDTCSVAEGAGRHWLVARLALTYCEEPCSSALLPVLLKLACATSPSPSPPSPRAQAAAAPAATERSPRIWPASVSSAAVPVRACDPGRRPRWRPPLPRR